MDINFPTDTAELTTVATNDLIPIYDVSAPGDLQEAQAINIAKTLVDDSSTTATDRVWSANKSKTELDLKASITGSQTLTNKTINADNNTITNLEVDNLKSGVLDTDLTSVSASDDTIPSAKATKAMGDLKIPLTYIDTDGTLAANSDVKLASQKAVKTYISNTIGFTNFISGTNFVIGESNSITSTTSTTYTKTKEIVIPTAITTGVVITSFELGQVSTTGTSYARIYRNGVAVGTERTQLFSGFTSAILEDISVSAGDLIQIYQKHSTGGDTCQVRNFYLKCNATPVSIRGTVNL